jgi:hypothetical protein
MAEPHVISILTAKYARLRGELSAANEQSRRIAKDMHHVECVIRLFRQEFEGRKIKAIRPHKPARWTRARQGMRYAIEVLKTAEGPLTSIEIAIRAAELAKLPPPDKPELWAMANAINTGMRRRLGTFIESDGGRPVRWFLPPT